MLIINAKGEVKDTIHGVQDFGVNGPWGAATEYISDDEAYVYVSMVLGADPARTSVANDGAIGA